MPKHSKKMIQDTVLKQEIIRQQNRQIARTLDDLRDLSLPKIVEERIKRGFYEMADNLLETIQENQINDPSESA